MKISQFAIERAAGEVSPANEDAALATITSGNGSPPRLPAAGGPSVEPATGIWYWVTVPDATWIAVRNEAPPAAPLPRMISMPPSPFRSARMGCPG